MELSRAVSENDLELVKRLLENGADVNQQDGEDDDNTPLHVAARSGSVRIGLVLINAGAHINVRNNEYETPLMVAISNDNEDFVELLLEQDNIDLNGALNTAVYLKNVHITTMLLDAGADPNKEYENETPLTTACYGPPELMQVLLDHGADINQGNDRTGATALMQALRVGNVPIIEYMLSRPDLDIDATNYNGWTALTVAVDSSPIEIIQLLLNAGALPTRDTRHVASLRRSDSRQISQMMTQYTADLTAGRIEARQTSVKRAMLQRRIARGENFPTELQLPQKELPQNILARAAYDELCTQLDKYNTKPQIQELARSLGIAPSNLSKAALCNKISQKLIL